MRRLAVDVDAIASSRSAMTVDRPPAGGEGAGAYEVRDRGRRARGAEARDRRRPRPRARRDDRATYCAARGYPAPAIAAHRACSTAAATSSSELLPGEPMAQPTTAHVAAGASRSSSSQRDVGLPGRDRRGSTTWSRASIEGPRSATASTRRMRAHSDETRALLDRLCAHRRRRTRRRRADRRRRALRLLAAQHARSTATASPASSTGRAATTGDAAFDLVTLRVLHVRLARPRRVARRGAPIAPTRARSRCTPRTWCCARSTGRCATTTAIAVEWFDRHRHRPVGRRRRWVGSDR